MSKVTRKEWYRRVNECWPKVLPALSGPEALRAARKLYRFGMGKTFEGVVQLTSGNRFTWIRGAVMSVNPNRYGSGWHNLVHDLSHYVHRMKNPGIRPHTGPHARIEMAMIKEVVKRGWLAGALIPAKPATMTVDPKLKELMRLVALHGKWVKRMKFAVNKVRKLDRKIKYRERFRHATDEAVAP